MFQIRHFTGDWHRDNMATVTNTEKGLSVEGKAKVMLQIINVKCKLTCAGNLEFYPPNVSVKEIQNCSFV
jgi:hypothetical protein